jgi:hypothetical protein
MTDQQEVTERMLAKHRELTAAMKLCAMKRTQEETNPEFIKFEPDLTKKEEGNL